MSQFVPSERLIVDDSITTGQAVSLDITPASPLLRICAILIDMMTTIFFATALAHLAINTLDAPSQSLFRVYITLFVVFFTVVLPVLVETLTRGRSLGKWALGLQVVRDDGGVISMRHSLVRAVTGCIEIWLSVGSIALLATMLNLRGKRLGDMAAGTMVITQPRPQSYYSLLMPPDAYAWASGAQVMRLPQPLVTRATLFLRENSSLVGQIRFATAVELAGELSRLVEPAPPRDLHPERVIAAILVLNRDRDMRRLERWNTSADQSRQRADGSIFNIK